MKKLLLFLYVCVLINTAQSQTVISSTPVANNYVYAIIRIGNTVYIGGDFTQLNGVAHTYLARYDANTGVVDSWSPVIDAKVTSIKKAGNKLIVAGDFTTVNSLSRVNNALFDLATGNLDTWSDNGFFMFNHCTGADNNNFYYASNNSGSSFKIKCVNGATGVATGWETITPLFGDGAFDVKPSGNYVYVGGDFTCGPCSYLCRFDKVSGVLDTAWQPNPTVAAWGIRSIAVHNTDVYVGGYFNTISGVARNGVAGFNAAGILLPFNQVSSAWEVYSVFIKGDYIWVGSNAWQLGGQSRFRIAEININTSVATCWDASPTSSNGWSFADAIFVSGDTVYTAPYGTPNLCVFEGSPRPHPAGGVITGPAATPPLSVATYSIPNVSGHTYNWNITGGSGTSITNSISVTWGTGPTGIVKVVENNPSGGINCYSDTLYLNVTVSSVGINEIDFAASITIAPNPFKSETTISFNEVQKNTTVTVIDIFGKVQQSYLFSGKEIVLKKGELKSGIYFFQVIDEKKNVVNRKVVIQ